MKKLLLTLFYLLTSHFLIGQDPCPIDLSTASIELIASQGTSNGTFNEGGFGITIQGNGWNALNIPQTIEAGTLLEFEFRSTEQGEEHAIGFANGLTGNDVNGNRFKLYGTQAVPPTNANLTYTYNGSGDWQSFSIPVGTILSGDYQYIVFVNDNDAAPTIGNSSFRNIKLVGGNSNCNEEPVDPPGTGGDCFVESGGVVVMEAENYSAATPGTGAQAAFSWQELSDPLASGGTAMGVPNGSGGGWTGLDLTGPRLDYDINFTQTGTYLLWVRTSAPTGNDDSFHAGLDGLGYTNTSGVGMGNVVGDWGWTNEANSGQTVEIVINTTGIHTLNIWMREDGVKVDKIIMTQAGTAPNGTGPAESAVGDCGGSEPANQAPVANIIATPTNGVAPLAINVEGTNSSDSDGTIINYTWDFGEGTTAFGATASHTYTDPGNYTARLTVTDDDGDTGTTTVSINVSPPVTSGDCFIESGGMVVMEAENYSAAAPGTGAQAAFTWQELSDPFASGGTAMEVPNGSGGGWTGLNLTGPRLDYDINFTQTGTYLLWVRTSAPTGNDDSFHAGLDGVSYTNTSGVGMGNVVGDWGWTNEANSGQSVEIVVNTPGLHTLNIWMREDGVKVDKMILTQASTAPNGIGPAQSTSGNCGGTPLPGIDLAFNFATATTDTPPEFIEDIGQPYGAKGALTYGWVLAADDSPIDVSVEARNRTPEPDADPIRETLIHLNRVGTSPPVKWEIELPNGTYQVIVQAGDSDTEGYAPTRHIIRAEGVTLIDYSPGVGGFGTRTAAQNITVSDGKLTIDGVGGSNAKINALAIQSAEGLRYPAITGAVPLDGTTNVSLTSTISANFLFLPNVSSNGLTSLDNSSITNSTVKLFKVNGATATEVNVTVNGTGGGDAINISVPSSTLEANTRYRYTINGVKDLAGATIFPYTAEFITGSSSGGSNPGNLDDVSFTRVGNVADGSYTTLAIGPDDKLYGLRISGQIDRWEINADGTLSNKQVLTGLTNAYGGERLSIGFAFAPNSTASNLVAYVTHSSSGLNNGPAWDGKLSRLTGANLQNETLVLTNLPRSIRDHLTNSIVFDPNDDNVLYFNQGSNSAGGQPDGAWGNRPERLLSAATLRLDLSKLPSNLPLNVQTSENQSVINNASTTSPTFSDGTYNPYFIDAALTIFASGVRNAYDLVWHSNGQLYIPTNGTAGGSNSPASVNGTRRPDGSLYNGPSIPLITGNGTQRDFLFRVNPNNPGGYYGHPNPKRGHFVLNRGFTDEDNYPASVQADANYRGFAFDFEFNKSPNGVIEYQSAGALQGALIVCRYSGGSDLIVLVPNETNGDIGISKIGIPGFTGFADPLDLVEDVNTGNIYVSDFSTDKIVLLKPDNLGGPSGGEVLTFTPAELIFEGIKNETVPNQSITITNEQDNAVTVNAVNISGGSSNKFGLANGINTPVTLNSGQSTTIEISYTTGATAGDFSSSLNLELTGGTTETIGLYGLTKNGFAGGGEPPLQQVLNTVGYDINVGGNTLSLPTSPAPIGEEVLAPVFEKAGSGPVTIIPVCRYSPIEPASFGYYTSNTPTAKTEVMVFTNNRPNSQTLFPTLSAGSTSFDATGSFGFYFTRNLTQDFFTQDALNTNTGVVHAFRIYPLKDRSGAAIANAYLFAVEEATNGDYNDYVFAIFNITPSAGNFARQAPQGSPIGTRERTAFAHDFRAIPTVEKQANLFWTLHQDKAVEWCMIQHAQEENGEYTDKDMVQGKASTGVYTYAYLDEATTHGTPQFYRIKIVYVDGHVEYTTHKEVLFEANSGRLSVFPNPTQGVLHVDLGAFMEKRIKVWMSDINGRVVNQTIIEAHHAEEEILDMSQLPRGMYMIYFHPEGQGVITQKVIVGPGNE